MKPVEIKASAKQLSKLRNGHAVRIQKAIEGQGIILLVHPERFDPISRSFNKGKGVEISLTPQELQANSEMKGGSIFGSAFRGVKRAARKTVKGVMRMAGEVAPEAGALALGGLATLSGQPELIPLAAVAGHHLGSRLQNNIGGPRNRIAPRSLQGAVEQNELFSDLNRDLGTHYGNLSRANLENAVSHSKSASYIRQGISGRGFRSEKGSVGLSGSLVAQGRLPPALMSQPFSANFQFQHTLPVQFQKFSKGGGLTL